ncbi:hypothetical protein EZV62_025524 [Acer yangbiense]|uniref:Malectin-like domain-containing protein n=1 Tax=Acer yangbiense TaxID=1000413 RepID=A0A5C7GYN9_9ROSI|nr:hypothetical protein EZV62_025524 [Acer yangbiense]
MIVIMINLSKMEKWVVIFTLFMAFLSQIDSYETYPFKNQSLLLINCGIEGSEDWEYYEGWDWAPDIGYINTGIAKYIQPQPNINVPGYLNSLRYFPHGVKNCYKVFPDPKYKFLFRAGFYYGNYDGLSRPPTFDLLLDGGFWATVNSSESEHGPIYKEILYSPKGESTSICLVMTHDNEAPFISSLVMAFVFVDDGAKPVYKLMGNNTALHLVSRTFFGGLDKVISAWTWETCDEYTFRIWQPKSVPGYLNISYNVGNENINGCLGFNYENRPPDSLLKNAISAANVSDSISLQVDFGNNTQRNAYFVLYFMDYNLSSENQNVSRKFEIYIDGESKKIVELNGDEVGQVATLYPVEVTGIANLRISPVNGSDFPPILNGMEVYTASEIVDTGGGFKLRCSCETVLFSFLVVLSILFV